MATTRIVQWLERRASVKVGPMGGGDEQYEECRETRAWVITGYGETDAAGRWSRDLRRLMCMGLPPAFPPPTLVATPTYPHDDIRPVLLVGMVNGNSLEITAFDLAGNRVAEVPFSWHCVVET